MLLPTAAGSSHSKGVQIKFFDEGVDHEFEVERPYGTPAMYRYFMREKFRRSVTGIEKFLDGASVLTVCGGSGMDAEFLARRGASVVCSDISYLACKRARERSAKSGVPFDSLVADVEALPFPDRSLDFVYVHDGLHHLENPYRGLEEIMRVAVLGISISEPTDAALTKLAIRLGLASEVEEAGNRVARFDFQRLIDFVQSKQFRVVHASRYAMYYRHEPGWIMQLLSAPILSPMTAIAWRFLNLVMGRLGNKATVVALSSERSTR